jgi:hypothetical protein
MRALLASIVLLSFTNIANAEVTTTQLKAACIKLDNGTPEKCDCMAEKFAVKLNRNENTYSLAILTSNEKLLSAIKGSLDDKKAETVKAKIIPLMMECLL